MGNWTIRRMEPGDWPQVCAIYAEGIATRNATFETNIPNWESWDGAHRADCRLVAVDVTGEAVGWAALSPISVRRVYSGVAEVSVYIAESIRGKGLGRALLGGLVAESERQGVWTLQASIFPENSASIAVHTACGFREVGLREKIGKSIDGLWRDVVLMERRSRMVGI